MSERTEMRPRVMNANQAPSADYSRLAVKVASDNFDQSDCIFTYHQILPEDSTYLYRVTAAAFEKHLAFISEVRGNSSNIPRPKISFDDGHRSNYEQAFPILERTNIKAIFFILAGCVGRGTEYVSWEDAKQMADSGHCVASHGWSHKILTQCSPVELRREVADSKHEIEDRLGIEVDSISAPGGRWSWRVAEACRNVGYRCFYHSNPWANKRVFSELNIQGRHMVTGRMGAEELHNLQMTGGMQRIVKSAIYSAKNGLRGALGDRLYHKIWCQLAKWNPEDGMGVQVGPSAPGK